MEPHWRTTRMSRARELLRSVKNLSVLRELAKTNGGLNGVGDLVDNFIDSEAMVVCLQRFKALPGGKEMVEQRYPPFQPDIPALEKLPEGTLGRAYAGMIRRLNYDADFFRPRDTSTEALWLTQRIASTHDLHHVIGGFNTETAGESGVLSITATQIGFPAYELLNTWRGSAHFDSNRMSLKRSAERSPWAAALAWKRRLLCCSAGRKAGRNPSISGAKSWESKPL